MWSTYLRNFQSWIRRRAILVFIDSICATVSLTCIYFSFRWNLTWFPWRSELWFQFSFFRINLLFSLLWKCLLFRYSGFGRPQLLFMKDFSIIYLIKMALQSSSKISFEFLNLIKAFLLNSHATIVDNVNLPKKLSRFRKLFPLLSSPFYRSKIFLYNSNGISDLCILILLCLHSEKGLDCVYLLFKIFQTLMIQLNLPQLIRGCTSW